MSAICYTRLHSLNFDIIDGTYASLQQVTPRDEQKSPDRNFFYEEPSIIERVIHGVSPKHLNNMPLNIKKDANTHQYDTVAEHKSADQPGSIYAVPEVDYSSNTQLPKVKDFSVTLVYELYYSMKFSLRCFIILVAPD